MRQAPIDGFLTPGGLTARPNTLARPGLEIFTAGITGLERERGFGDEATARRARGGSARLRVDRRGRSRLPAMDADALSTTPAAQAARQALRAAAGAAGPMERHCQRQFAIAERLAGGRAFDRELLLCACWLHDAGLYIPSHDPYVTEGARLADRVLAPFGWPPRAAAALHGRLRAAPAFRTKLQGGRG